MPEMMTARATSVPAQEPLPTMASAAAEYDALLPSRASALAGRIPKTATSESM